MHTVEDLENTLKDIFITTESTYNQQVELENLLEEVDPRSLIRTIWENCQSQYDMESTDIDRVLQTLPFSQEPGPFSKPKTQRPLYWFHARKYEKV